MRPNGAAPCCQSCPRGGQKPPFVPPVNGGDDPVITRTMAADHAPAAVDVAMLNEPREAAQAERGPPSADSHNERQARLAVWRD